MSTPVYYALGVLVMAVVTYIPRMLPLSLLRRRVESRFLQSFLYYMPYAVLGAMTFPAILEATATPWSAAVGHGGSAHPRLPAAEPAAGGLSLHCKRFCGGMDDGTLPVEPPSFLASSK